MFLFFFRGEEVMEWGVGFSRDLGLEGVRRGGGEEFEDKEE